MSEIVPHTPAWREWRRGGIGGSDAPVITGDDTFRRPLTLWLQKTGMLDDVADDLDDDEPRYWGKRLEPAVIERFERDTGLAVISRQLCVEHHLDRWRRATIDGLVMESRLAHPDNALGIFEGKTSSRVADWRDGVPAYVQIQVQHTLDVCELEHAWVAVLLTAPVVHFQLHEIERDEAITGPLRELEARFWRRVLENDPPAPQSADLEALKQAYRDTVGESIALDDFGAEHDQITEPVESVIAELVDARAAARAAERRVESAEAILAVMLQEHETGTLGGMPVINWRRHEREYIDTDALRAKHPKLVARFTTKRGYRKFSIPKGGHTNGDESR